MQAVSLFISCLALMMMILGVIQKEWAKLEWISSGKSITSSPWIICVNLNCTNINPTDEKKIIWNLMAITLTFSVILSFALAMDYTYLIPRIKGRNLIFAFISFFTGTCLLTAIILYYQELRKSFSTYYYEFKINWISHSTFIIIFLYFLCGILCIINHKQSNDNFQDFLTESTVQHPQTQVESVQTQTDDIERRRDCHSIRQDFTKMSYPSSTESRRVTWAL